MRAFGFSSGLAVKVGNEDPGPQRMMAWNPGAGIERAWGIVRPVLAGVLDSTKFKTAAQEVSIWGKDNVFVVSLAPVSLQNDRRRTIKPQMMPLERG
jgi:hypothetical protein